MTSEYLKSCVFTQEYLEFQNVIFSRNEPVRRLFCGSFFELPIFYFLSNPTDVDVILYDITLCAIYNQVRVAATRESNVVTIDTTDCHVGYARLRNGREYYRKPYNFNKGPSCTRQMPIRSLCLRSLLRWISTRWRDIETITEDNVFAISCPLWPPEAYEWKTRERLNGWPPADTINAIFKSGCHLVSKPHANNPSDDTQWRYSFSQAEIILVHSWTYVQKYIYHLLRIIKRDVVSKCGGENETFISSYYFKTLMLWSCEVKPSAFWEDRNIVTSVRELLLDLIEKLIDRNVPHYFMKTYNLMDDLPCDAEIENEIHSLLSYGEKTIFEIMQIEPKAYQMTPYFLIISNESLYPLAIWFSQRSCTRGKLTDGCLRESDMLYCSGKPRNGFYSELEYLHRGLVIHLKLSELNANDNQNRKRRDDLIVHADELFDLSIHKLDYGFTRIPFHLGWSISELWQEMYLSCIQKHVQDRPIRLMGYSWSGTTSATSSSCYLRDRDNYIGNIRNVCAFSTVRRIERKIFSLVQEIFLVGVTTAINPTYIVCSAYRANFFYNVHCDFRKALDLCEEVRKILSYSPVQNFNLVFANVFSFPLRNEWCRLYDKYIQIIFGFLTLHRILTASSAARKRTISVYICSHQ